MSGRRLKPKIKPYVGPSKKKAKTDPDGSSSRPNNPESTSTGLKASVLDVSTDQKPEASSHPNHIPLAGFVSPRRQGLSDDSPLDSPQIECLSNEGSGLVVKREKTSPNRETRERGQENARNRSAMKMTLMSPRRSRSTLTDSPQTPDFHPKFQRRIFTGDEALNTQSMTFSDLISWNPKQSEALDWLQTEASKPLKVPENPQPYTPVAAPQLKIDSDGNVVLDESSLVIRGDPEAQNEAWEVVDDDRVIKNLSSTTYRRRLKRTGIEWTYQETETFYELLQSCGTDFGLMHQFFPSRARSELHAKFNLEKKRNSARLDFALANPAFFDKNLEHRAKVLSQRLEQEMQTKWTFNRRLKRKFRVEDVETAIQPLVVNRTQEEGITRNDVAALTSATY
ncbi:hypothetical protein L596_010126 [Steinernema carpocapsae]|uniref:Transcription factor TFIIIB component B'' Myb domain-containing protein n=1 Tax=Steinernema carpocapsae TaxID=34508 RepID=A0A4U5PHE4_STECR|nr:hypothetical protein L596_010126 [Steinernema carpocapsae]